MAIKAVVENLDAVEERHRALYVEQDGHFVLEVEGAESLPSITALRNAHERQKQEHVRLITENAELKTKVPEGFSTEEFDRLKAVGSAHDPSHAKTVADLRESFTAEIAARHATIARLDAFIAKKSIQIVLRNELVNAGVKKEFLNAVFAMHQHAVRVVEGGRAMVKTRYGFQSVKNFVQQWAKSDEGKAFISASPTCSPAAGSFTALIRALQ